MENHSEQPTHVDETQGASASGAAPSGQDGAYSEPVLGLEPTLFADDVINAATEYSCDAIDTIELKLREECIPSDASTELRSELERKIHHCLNDLMEKLKDSIDANFDKFELYLKRNIFKVPDGIVVPPFQKREDVANGEEENALNNEIKVLRKKLSAAKYMRGAMHAEIEALNQVDVNKLQEMAGDMGSVESAAPLVENIMENVRQLKDAHSDAVKTMSGYNVAGNRSDDPDALSMRFQQRKTNLTLGGNPAELKSLKSSMRA